MPVASIDNIAVTNVELKISMYPVILDFEDSFFRLKIMTFLCIMKANNPSVNECLYDSIIAVGNGFPCRELRTSIYCGLHVNVDLF